MSTSRQNRSWSRGVSRKLQVRLDADASGDVLYHALLERGHDATCTTALG